MTRLTTKYLFHLLFISNLGCIFLLDSIQFRERTRTARGTVTRSKHRHMVSALDLHVFGMTAIKLAVI